MNGVVGGHEAAFVVQTRDTMGNVRGVGGDEFSGKKKKKSYYFFFESVCVFFVFFAFCGFLKKKKN